MHSRPIYHESEMTGRSVRLPTSLDATAKIIKRAKCVFRVFFTK